jgi:hypothetical protein
MSMLILYFHFLLGVSEPAIQQTKPGPLHPPPNPCSNPIKCPGSPRGVIPATRRPGNGPRR